jgi:hypothetical protein
MSNNNNKQVSSYAFRGYICAGFSIDISNVIMNMMKIGKIWPLAIMLLFGFFYTNAQQVLLSGTSFDPVVPSDTSRFYWGIGEVQYYGIQTGGIVMTTPLAPNVNNNIFNSTSYYAVTNNPNKLDRRRYTNLVGPARDNQLVISKMAGDGTNLFIYNVANAKSYTDVKVVYDYCYVRNNTLPGCTSGFNGHKIAVNPDASNLVGGGPWVYANSPTICRKDSVVATGASSSGGFSRQVGVDGNISIYFNNAGTDTDSCKIIGIKSINVWGTPKPKVKRTDEEVCTKEVVGLLTEADYYNVNYKWEVQVGSSTTWTTVGANAAENYEPQADNTYKFRVTITTKSAPIQSFISDTLTVKSITCCMENGQPASRKTIYYDDFGRLNPADPTGLTYYTTDYTDIANPLDKLNTTTSPYRWKANPEPVGHTYESVAGQPPNDGEYIVGANLTNATVGYANNITGYASQPTVGYDRSGTKEGGVLLINICDQNCAGNVLYNRTISGICAGKKIYFEGYFTVFTNSTPGPDVKIEVTDIASGNTKTTPQFTVNPRSENTNTGWRRLSDTLTLTGNSLNIKITTNTNGGTGKDLAIDDIRIKICAPPSLEAYFDLTTLSKEESVCNLSQLDLFGKPSSLLANYYGNNQRYLYQWSKTPNVLNSWQNIGTPITATQVLNVGSVATDTALTRTDPRGPIYFRIIAATANTFTTKNNFQGGLVANPNDPCSSDYTVSDEIKLNIACLLPSNWLYFKGEKTSIGNRLSWSVIKTTGNTQFVVQKSIDGYLYYDIGKVDAATSSQISNKSYIFNDIFGKGYYRIIWYKENEYLSTSSTIYLSGQERESEFYILPNPNNGEFMVSGSREGLYLDVELYDLGGRSVPFYKSIVGESQVKISGLLEGVYIVKIHSESDIQTQKVVVYK